MLGINKYQLTFDYRQNFTLITNSTSNYLTYKFFRSNSIDLSPVMLCFGFCKDGQGPLNNSCVNCPKYSLTCANMSF